MSGRDTLNRGEIWWASLPEPQGSGPGYRRPVLIVQSDDFNRSNIKTVICAVITSNLSLAGAPGNVRLSSRASRLPRASVVNVSQVMAVDKGYFTERVSALDQSTMRQVDSGLRVVLNL